MVEEEYLCPPKVDLPGALLSGVYHDAALEKRNNKNHKLQKKPQFKLFYHRLPHLRAHYPALDPVGVFPELKVLLEK